jgi:chemotaxis protein methyltransferase CheR
MSGRFAASELETLACHLTVGETYFFREKRSFDILAEQILPALAQARRKGRRQLRIWSAACCTGEEPYSIAIALLHSLPNWQEWDITILASDINSRFLRKAAAGIYGQWSFRNAPAWLKQRYFHPLPNGQFQIQPRIKQMVQFTRLNLVEDVYPSLTNNTHTMDVIFCRNVLMYFTPLQARKVIQKLFSAQANRGWLIVGPSELLQSSCEPYTARNFQGAILFQKGGKPTPTTTTHIPFAIESSPPADCQTPIVLREQPVAPAVLSKEPSSGSSSPAELRRAAHSLAGEGKLAEALDCCDRWIAADRLDPLGHYLRANILQEQGASDDAVESLRKALYLDPNCVLAHFAMGNIARNRGDAEQASKHLGNARKLLHRYRPDELVWESEGVTAARFIQIVDSLLEMEGVA